MPNGSNKGIYAFDEFRLDAEKLMLYRDEAEISIPPKVVKTLAVLVENQGSILSKDELIERVWADSIVEESNLSQYLYLLRKTLGNRPNGQPYIETLRRRGYRFNGDVRRIDDQSAQHSNGSGDGAGQMPRTSIERQGNVLRLVDWNVEADTAASVETTALLGISVVAEEPVKSDEGNFVRNTVLAVGGLLAFAGLAVLVWSGASAWSSAPEPEKTRGELNIVRLTNGLTPMDAAISRDGKYFTYHEQDGETFHFWLQQTGHSTRVEVLPPSERVLGSKTFSPDGQFIYFLALNKGETKFSLYRVPTLGGAQTKILTPISSPVSFSPDGREIVFLRYDEKGRVSRIVIANSDGGNERIVLTADQTLLTSPAWAPDGKQIAYGHSSLSIDAGGCTIKAIQPDGNNVRVLSPEKWDVCCRSDWLRDGKRLVFIGTKAGESVTTRREQIYLLSTVTGEARRVTSEGKRHHLDSFGVTNDDSIIAVPYDRSAQIWVMDPNGDTRSAVQITNGIADGRAGIAPMTNGRVAYLTRTGEKLTVWLMNADGSEQGELLNNPSFVEELRASPDGRYLVFSAHEGRRLNRLFRVDADGANLRQLTFGEVRAIDSTISPRADSIVYTGLFEADGRNRYPLFRTSIDGGEPVRLTEKDCGTPHFSPDGKFLSCIVDYEKEFVIMSSDGSVVKSFAAAVRPIMNIGVRWTPDGKNLVYIVLQKDVGNLWLQPVEGGKPRPLTNFTAGSIYNFVYSADGTRLYLSRGAHQQNDAVLITNFE